MSTVKQTKTNTKNTKVQPVVVVNENLFTRLKVKFNSLVKKLLNK